MRRKVSPEGSYPLVHIELMLIMFLIQLIMFYESNLRWKQEDDPVDE